MIQIQTWKTRSVCARIKEKYRWLSRCMNWFKKLIEPQKVSILMIELWKSIHKYNSRTQSVVLIYKLLH